MKCNTKLIVLLSDLHVGSTIGLWPPDFISNEGNPIGQNKFQEWLWECWQDAAKWSAKLIGKDAFEIVLNGDLVEGIHHRSLQVMTPDVGDQSEAVKQVLEPLAAKASKLSGEEDKEDIGAAMDIIDGFSSVSPQEIPGIGRGFL